MIENIIKATNIINDSTFINQFGINSSSLEGYLYPDTEDLDNDFMLDTKDDYFHLLAKKSDYVET